jgi:ADP-heptose:LPS heptosyltransferase
LKKLGAKVLLEVQPELVSLMRSLDGVENVSEIGNSPTVYDFETPLLSLPLAFKTQVNNIPSNIPYLYVESDKKDFWANRFSANTMRPHIGITWAGNPKHQNDRNRSLELRHLSKLVSTKFEWIALSTNLSKLEKEVTRSVGIKNYAIDVKDFSDTAGLICNLDLVITVDTSVAHLAGALGKPTWVLLPFVPDFRWFWDREDSPWYPSMRLFRQSSPGDWDSVLSRVTSELDNHFKLN